MSGAGEPSSLYTDVERRQAKSTCCRKSLLGYAVSASQHLMCRTAQGVLNAPHGHDGRDRGGALRGIRTFVIALALGVTALAAPVAHAGTYFSPTAPRRSSAPPRSTGSSSATRLAARSPSNGQDPQTEPIPNPYTSGPGVGGVNNGNKGYFGGLYPWQLFGNFPWSRLRVIASPHCTGVPCG